MASHGRTVEFLGGVPAAVVPDQLKPGVRDACRYEPVLQRTYEEWAAHYGTVILPARPAKPRDKAKVEVAVQVAQRWILARLRDETFFSLAALNARIRELLADLNARSMKGYGGLSRRDLFLRFDQPALRPLPTERFVYAEWYQARVNIDYHIDVARHRAAGEQFLATHYRRFSGQPACPLPLPSVPDDYEAQLRDLRRRMRLTQDALARRIGAAGKAVVYQWESRKRRPSPVLWQRVLDLERPPASHVGDGDAAYRETCDYVEIWP